MSKNGNNQSDNNNGHISFKAFEIVCGIVIVICLFGVIGCGIQFAWTMHIFSKESRQVLQIISSSFSPDQMEVINDLIAHMETMVDIQKSGMTNDLLSFIYGILSSTLVGLCAGFVLKSRANADEAKETADKAKQNAEIAKTEAEKATKEAEGTRDAIKKSKELGYQVRLVVISSRILTTKQALLKYDNIYANRAIIYIHREITSLFSDKELFESMNNFILADIEKVYDELTDLHTDVDNFEKECKKKYKGDIYALKSMETAADNYRGWIQKTIKTIDKASKAVKKPEE